MLRKVLLHLIFALSRRFLPGRLYRVRDELFSAFGIHIKDVFIPIGNTLIYIDTNNYHERGIFTFGAFEPGTTRFLNRFISSLADSVVVDIGANIGIHTLTMCEARRSGRGVSVIAVEPNPDMVFRLKRNLRINNFQQVHVCQLGASAGAEHIQLGLPYADGCSEYHNPGIASMVQVDQAVRLIEVECRPLDDIVRGLGFSTDKVGLVKMDVEGKELDVLRGMKDILRDSDAAIIIEYNNSIFHECKEFLEVYGFDVVGSLVSYGIDSTVLTENVCFMKSTATDKTLVGH